MIKRVNELKKIELVIFNILDRPYGERDVEGAWLISGIHFLLVLVAKNFQPLYRHKQGVILDLDAG
jgi:hypothetical protein